MALTPRELILLLFTFLNHPPAVYSAGHPAQERADRAGLEESHEKGQMAGAPLLQRNAEGIGIVPGKNA